MSPGRANEVQAREETDRLQRSDLFDASFGRKPAISEYRPGADLRGIVRVPQPQDSCIEAPIRREGLPDGLLKGRKA